MNNEERQVLTQRLAHSRQMIDECPLSLSGVLETPRDLLLFILGQESALKEILNEPSSPSIAKRMRRVYGCRTKEVMIEMLHEKEVGGYVMSIEAAHKKAAKSKLTFP